MFTKIEFTLDTSNSKDFKFYRKILNIIESLSYREELQRSYPKGTVFSK